MILLPFEVWLLLLILTRCRRLVEHFQTGASGAPPVFSRNPTRETRSRLR
jgi:hypothetical protein